MTLQAALRQTFPSFARGCFDKKRYTRKQAAGKQVKNGFRLRPYHCQLCGGYHLTKKLKK
jgi:hypothetical protein